MTNPEGTRRFPDILAGGHDPIRHPALTEPKTKTGWRRYCDLPDPVPPAKLTWPQYESLSEIDKRRYDRDRARFHSQLVIVESAPLVAFRDHLADLLDINMFAQAGPRVGLVVSGAGGVGKSTAVKTVTREYERQLRSDYPDYFAREGNAFVPVAYLPVPHKVTPRSLLLRLATYFERPVRRGITAIELLPKVVELIEECGTQILVIDDLHFLKMQGTDGEESNNLIKELLNQTGITFVAAGIDLDESPLFPSKPNPTAVQEQNGGRFDLLPFAAASCATRADSENWVGTIRAFEDALVLLRHEPGTLPCLYEYLHMRTAGKMQAISELIRKGARKAITTGTERIDEALLEQVRIDLTSEVRISSSKKSKDNRPSRGLVS